MNDAEKIFDLLAEIQQELQDHIVGGKCQFDEIGRASCRERV